LEVNAAVRHDHYSDFGSADTGKASLRYKVTPQLLFRASAGTGFHAPTVPQVNAAPQPFGVTSGTYTCTPELAAVAAQVGAVCRPGAAQYDVQAGGNPLLKPEKSRQGSIGLRFEPIPELSVGADLWHVAIRDSFGQLPEATVFATPLQFPGAWTKTLDIGTGSQFLTWNAGNLNLGKSYSTGLDVDATLRLRTAVGQLTSQVNATYMIREVAQQLINGPYFSAVGDYNDNVGGPTFRFLAKWMTTLKTGPWANTISLNYKSGYRDQTTTVDVLDAQGNATGTEDLRIKVKSYTTVDLQSSYEFKEWITATVGLLNAFNQKPPLSISVGGTNRGQQFGYDDRFYDPRGRTIYANVSVKF
jgi:iron complex outermembrane receptor protein